MSTPTTPEPQPTAQPTAQPVARQQPAYQQQAPQQPAYTQQHAPQPQAPQQPAYALQQAAQQQVPQQAPQQPAYAQQQAAQHAQRPTQQPVRAAQPVQLSQATTLGGTNTFALLAIIFAFISPIAGIIFGHMGLSQIKRTGDAGRGIGLTGLIISYAAFVFVALFVFAYAFMIFAIVGTMGTAFNDYTLS